MTDHPLDVSLIVVNYHSGEPLRSLLDSLERHPVRASHEIIVVDNSPGDGVAEWLDERAPEARRLDSGRNVGYARAVNAGIEAARGREVLVINPDVKLEEGSVDRCLDYLHRHPEVGLLGVRLVNADGSDQHNARRFYSLTTILLRRTPYGRLRPHHPELRRHLMLDDDLSEPGPVDWVTGAFMMVRREALERVGPMDRRFFLYFEDVDWCQRMWDGGYEVHLLPDVELAHEHQRTSTRLNQSLWHHVRSFFSYYEKWGALIYVTRRFQQGWRRGAAIVTDVLALNLAFVLAFGVRRLLDPFFAEPLFAFVAYLPLLAFTNVVSLVTLLLMGRYEKLADGHERSSLESLRVAFLVTLVVMAATYLSHTRTFSRAVLLLFVPFYLGALEITRQFGERVLRGADRATARVRRILLASGPRCTATPAATEPVVLAGRVGPVDDGGAIRRLGDWEDLPRVVDRYRIEEVLVPVEQGFDRDLATRLRQVAREGGSVLVEDPWMAAEGRARRRRLGRRWAVLPHARGTTLERWKRRLVDRSVGLLLLLVSLPFFVLCFLLGRPIGRVRTRTVSCRSTWGETFRWKELVSGAGDRPLIGLVQSPRYLQVLRGRLALVGSAVIPSGCHDEIDGEDMTPTGERPGLIRTPATHELAEVAGRAPVASEVDLFLSSLPSLLLGRAPHWFSRE